MAALRRWRTREMVRLAWRDLAGFAGIHETLLEHGDFYMHLADLPAYVETQSTAGKLYADPDAWFRKVVINIASSGRFSSDRAIQEYLSEIWHALPCPVPPLDCP